MVSLLFRRSREGGVRGLAREWAGVRRGDVPATAVTGAVRRLDVRVVRVRHGSRLGSASGGIKKKLSAAWWVHEARQRARILWRRGENKTGRWVAVWRPEGKGVPGRRGQREERRGF